MQQDDLFASVAGVVERDNKLISVTPVKTRYNGEIGDVVVGRIVELLSLDCVKDVAILTFAGLQV